MRKTALAQQLAVVAGFEKPQASLEQYPTPPELAAHLIHIADLLGDIENRTVFDLGTGTGMLALGAALRGPAEVVGLDLDGGALRIAQENRRRVGTTTPISWVRADVTRPPLGDRTGDRSTERTGNDDRSASDGRDPKANDENHGTDGEDRADEDREGSADDRAEAATDRSTAGQPTTNRSVTVVMNPPFGAQRDNEHADRAFLETTSQVADVSYSVHNRGSRDFIGAFAADNGGEITQGFRAEISLPRQFDFHGEETKELDVEVFRIAWSD